MRVAWAAALLVLVGCSSPASQRAPAPPRAAEPVISCVEPRPEVCTMEYVPVCATLASGGSRTYASACTACADPAVAGYQDGLCSE